MFHYLLIGYIVVYCIFAIFLEIAYARTVSDEKKETDKPWETSVDIALAIIGLVGMLFLVTDFESGSIKTVWKFVSIALAVTQGYLNLKGRLDMFRSGEFKQGAPEAHYTDVSTTLFLLPSICLNIYYAFR